MDNPKKEPRPQDLKTGVVELEKCDHGVTFDLEAAKKLDKYEIRRRWPRLFGKCPKGCGYLGIAYASTQHYLMGDW